MSSHCNAPGQRPNSAHAPRFGARVATLRARRHATVVPGAALALLAAAVSSAVTPERCPGARWVARSGEKGITELQRRAYADLARLPEYGTESPQGPIAYAFARPKENPAGRLAAMGLDVLPVLAEALDDFTPTKAVTVGTQAVFTPTGRRVSRHMWLVNDIAARLVCFIAARHFVLGEWGSGASLQDLNSHRGRIPEFQRDVLDWYNRNKDRTLEEREIADLESNLRNRLDAEMWLGAHESRRALRALMGRVDAVLAGKGESPWTQDELAELSRALGQIGDGAAFPAVRRACDFLRRSSFRPATSATVETLFRAYHAMALLAHKDEALKQLRSLYSEYGAKMSRLQRQEYESRLAQAQTW